MFVCFLESFFSLSDYFSKCYPRIVGQSCKARRSICEHLTSHRSVGRMLGRVRTHTVDIYNCLILNSYSGWQRKHCRICCTSLHSVRVGQRFCVNESEWLCACIAVSVTHFDMLKALYLGNLSPCCVDAAKQDLLWLKDSSWISQHWVSASRLEFGSIWDNVLM